MVRTPEDDRPSSNEIERRIEVALANARVENAAEVAAIAARAVQPTIDSLKSQRVASKAAAEFVLTVSGYVRSHPPSDLRSSILAALQDLEPWNGEWRVLAQEGA